ncbi:MAG: ABC transporter substrate-binding protein [Bacteroidota bacterium]
MTAPVKGRRILLLLSFLLAAAPASALRPAAGSVVRLTIWTHHRHMDDLTQELIDEFNRTVGRRKGIRVVQRVLGDDAWDLFQKAQERGEGPDLYSAGFVTRYADPFAAGAQTWFDDLPGFDRWKRQWPSWYWIEGTTTYRGHVYAIPAQVLNSRLIYNRDLFRAAGLDPDRPPRSYPELLAAARRITEKGKGRYYGFAFCGGESWWLEWMPSQWAEANGDPAWWDWSTGRWAMNGFARVFRLILDLQKDGSLFPGAAVLTNDALRAQFAEGRIGMFMGEFWDVGVLNDQFPARCDWAVAPIPTYDGAFHGKSRAMIIGGLWTINGRTRHKLEAWEVVRWFNRYEVRARLYERGKCIDPDPAVVRLYVRRRPTVKGFRAFADTLDQDYRATYPYLPGWQPPRDNPAAALRRLLARGGEPDAELRRVDELWNGALDRYYAANPHVKRNWNVYPRFDRRVGALGPPLEIPSFAADPGKARN